MVDIIASIFAWLSLYGEAVVSGLALLGLGSVSTLFVTHWLTGRGERSKRRAEFLHSATLAAASPGTTASITAPTRSRPWLTNSKAIGRSDK